MVCTKIGTEGDTRLRAMSTTRALIYAEAQARILARVGDMPDAAQWRYISEARDLDTLIARMRENGLQRWIRDLPRAPDTIDIERQLESGVLELLGELDRLIPGNLTALRRWLRSGAELRNAPQPAGWLGWWSGLSGTVSRLPRHDRASVARLHALVERHLNAILGASRDTASDPDRQWQWRNELIARLGTLRCGDPFNVGLILIYGLLQVLQFERARALLISVSRGWEPPDVLRGAV